jgi:uncharacterized Tic20 family protein
MEATDTPSLPPRPKGGEKIWSILSHLSALMGVAFLLPLVVYLAMKDDSPSVTANAREALNFHISILVYGVCCIPLVFVVIGIPLLVLIGVASLVLAVVAAIKASEGGCYHYPFTLRLVK